MEAADASPLCRFFVNCFLAELFYFPYFVASDFREKVAVERHLNAVLNLDRARAEGLIGNWSLKWAWTTNTQFPRWPTRLYIRLPRGQRLKLALPRPLLAEIARVRTHGLRTPLQDPE